MRTRVQYPLFADRKVFCGIDQGRQRADFVEKIRLFRALIADSISSSMREGIVMMGLRQEA